MDANAVVRRLEGFPRGLTAVVDGLTPDEWRWKPPSGNWCVLEIMCHLGDEEVEDFRARTLGTLRDPSAVWPTIDSTAWPRERGYMNQDPAAALSRFVRERAESIRQLNEFAAAHAGGDVARIAWDTAYQHPKVGLVPAGEVFASWAAHDALHLRQISKRIWELAGRDGAPYATKYAGEWGA